VATNTTAATTPSDTPVTTLPVAEEKKPVTTETAVPAGTDNYSPELKSIDNGDGTPGKLLGYITDNKPVARNPQASNQMDKAIDNLAKLEKEYASAGTETSAGASTPDELRKRNETLLAEADALNEKAAETRRSAAGKPEEEQTAIYAEAKKLQAEAQLKTIDASKALQQATDLQSQANTTAIDDMLGKLDTDNPTLGAQLRDKKIEVANLKDQAKKLREEADQLTSDAAKVGAYSNAEEKEAELLQKQDQLINELKKQYPDYIVNPPAVPATSSTASPEEVAGKRAVIRNKQAEELTNLTNAFTLEFETSKKSFTKNPDAAQKAARQRADALNADSKKLLIDAAKENNADEKLRLLTLSARAGNAALKELNTGVVQTPVAGVTEALNDIGNRMNGNPAAAEPPAATPKPAAGRNRGAFSIEGLEIIKGNAYNPTKPIPLDASMPDGLIFRVQIGAFKTRLAEDAFKGLSPLNGETTQNGLFRYTAGNFVKYENANAVKNDLRSLGYSDAFVVGYFNGKRISVAEALAMLSREGKTVDPNAPQSAGITAANNIPPAAVNVAFQELVTVANELEKMQGLFYTVQIGVFNRQVTNNQLLNLAPIFTEKLRDGVYRFTAGVYNNTDKLIADKNKVVALGMRDAFVSAYFNGRRIPYADARNKQAADPNIKFETENPIRFPGQGLANANVNTNNPNANAPAVGPKPAGNNVSGYPAATADNGVKPTEEGICFKVQIGAYSKQVPADVLAKFNAIKTWPVEYKQAGNLFIYNIGNFSEARFAKALRAEAVRIGLNDAFISVYRDGKKIYGAEASQLIAK
jgi:hypothetical protein